MLVPAATRYAILRVASLNVPSTTAASEYSSTPKFGRVTAVTDPSRHDERAGQHVGFGHAQRRLRTDGPAVDVVGRGGQAANAPRD